jgi:hypothetical protein
MILSFNANLGRMEFSEGTSHLGAAWHYRFELAGVRLIAGAGDGGGGVQSYLISY